MKRLYTEIRIEHKTEADKEEYEAAVKRKYKAAGFSNRAEYIRYVSTNADLRDQK